MSKNNKTTQGDFVVRYTNKDIMDKLSSLGDKLDDVHVQAKRTNGRVNNLEAKSVGLWISNHPFKFFLFSLIFIAIVISDIRQPLVAFLLRFI